MELQVFQNAGFNIRGGLIDGEPFFVAKDICFALEITNVSAAVSRLDDDEKGIIKSDTLGGVQDLLSINESGMYSLILRSNKPEAKRFKKWVTSEVLPSIRKTGQYQRPLTQAEQIQLIAQGYQDVDDRLKILEQTKRLEAWQERALIDAKNRKVYYFNPSDAENTSKLHRAIWAHFKKHFNLPRYNELPAVKFDDGIEFISRISLIDLVG